MSENPLEIPQALRDMSERNLKQARAAYEQLIDVMTKAMGAWIGAVPSNPMAAVVKDVQDRAMQIAKENAESVFTFAGKISNVRPPQDILTLQTQFEDSGEAASARAAGPCWLKNLTLVFAGGQSSFAALSACLPPLSSAFPFRLAAAAFAPAPSLRWARSLRMLSPLSSILCALWTMRSRMASA